MITKDQNKACLLAAEEACGNPAWRDYGEYCRSRERGLRKQAFAHLNAFLDAAQSWGFDDRRTFVQWLCEKMDTVGEADYGPYPTPLAKRLFQPLFDEWIQNEPSNAEAFALKAQYAPDFDSYRKAVQIDPENQRARLALAREKLGSALELGVCYWWRGVLRITSRHSSFAG
jgi:hypothetical protein